LAVTDDSLQLTCM